jgi:hypothetical protein
MKKWRVVSNDLNNAEALFTTGPARAGHFGKWPRRLQLTSLEQLSLVLESKARNRPAHKETDTTVENICSIVGHALCIATCFYSATLRMDR